MNGLSVFCAGTLSSTNGPNRFVGHRTGHQRHDADFIQNGTQLTADHFNGLAGFALLQRFTNADNRHNTVIKCDLDLFSNRLIGFTEKRAAFGVAENNQIATDIGKHRGGHFAGVGALSVLGTVLRTH